MIVVRLKGGLGNQMFQYALGRVLSIKNSTSLKLDASFYSMSFNGVTKRAYDLDVFNIHASITNTNDVPILHKNIHNKFVYKIISILKKFFDMNGVEKSFKFDMDILNIKSDIYLEGYWQSYKYFIDYEEIIRKDFTLKSFPALNMQEMANEIESMNSVSVHVRRGDYVGNNMHDVVSESYYKKGIEYISNKVNIDKIYVFSDDIEWCKDNLKFDYPVVFVGEEFTGVKDEGHVYLMSKCKHFIIANSSFSWWGAWLSTNHDKIVVCPKQWFGDASIDTSDLIPDNWIRI